MKNSLLIIGYMFMALMVSCVETEPVSPIPEITFKKLEIVQITDGLGNKIIMTKLQFTFIDGNADIGIEQGISDNPALPDSVRFNVFINTFEKKDNYYLPVVIDTADTLMPPPYSAIFQNDKLERVGQNKTIKGTITLNMPYYLLPDYDTIRYEFYIRDRAGNKSNVEVTSDIGFKGIKLTSSVQ
jgi:hypothetical protein